MPIGAAKLSILSGVMPSVSTTPTPTITPSVTPTRSITPTASVSVSVTPSITSTPTRSITPTASVTPSVTPTASITPSITSTPANTITPTASVTPSVTPTASITPSITSSPAVSVTPTVSITPTASVSVSVTPTTTPTKSVTPTASVTPTESVTPTASIAPTASVTPSVTPTASIAPTASITPAVSITPTTTPSITPNLDTSIITTSEISSMNIVGVWSMKQKVQGYNGPIWKIRRDSDDSLQDCYSVSEATAFIGAGAGYVYTWYDQSGNSYNFNETTNSNQPVFISYDASVGGAMVKLADGTGMTGSYGDDGTNPNVTYATTYTTFESGGKRVLAGSSNWLLGPYSNVYSLYAGSFANGPAAVIGQAAVNTAWRSSGGSWLLRVNETDVGGSAGTGAPGNSINLGIRGAFAENAGSLLQNIIFAVPSATNNTTKVAAIEAKLTVDIL